MEHIFFHSLIVYPQLAFDDKGHPASGCNTWFVTVDEFKKMLPQLKERGYVLVGINDVNYYDYMKPDGFAEKLVVDDNNEVFTLVKNMEGKEEITRDGDLVPILDDFIKDNPEFSYKGAKGTLAVTGYEGALGYRLDSESSKEEAKKTAKALKADGWTFASHSFTHNGDGYFQGVQNYDNLQYDFNKWNELIKPIVGETNIYISPFGAMLEGSNINLVPENGFDIYCNVSRFPEDEYSGNLIITPRYNIDGYTLFNCKDSLNKLFFNADEVMTPGVRPNTLE
ncbi:MAG: hypothetical protein PUE01_00170 [Clostridiaceae bacterium]|nr:hypothetical protein [Clostridiaceae bacterium]